MKPRVITDGHLLARALAWLGGTSLATTGLWFALPGGAYSRSSRRDLLGRLTRSKYYPHCGAQERARRIRQIAEGRLKVENGLMLLPTAERGE